MEHKQVTVVVGRSRKGDGQQRTSRLMVVQALVLNINIAGFAQRNGVPVGTGVALRWTGGIQGLRSDPTAVWTTN